MARPSASTMADVEIDAHSSIRSVIFSANAEHLLSGGPDGVQVWRVEDGRHMATMEVKDVSCLAASKNGKWIATGTKLGYVVWNAQTYEQVFKHWEDHGHTINAVEFSPDSSRLITASGDGTATIRDLVTRKQHTLPHESGAVIAAKYSPNGDRIATATHNSVRVWDRNDSRLLVDIPVKVTSSCNAGLFWFNDHIFVISGNAVKQFEASTGLLVAVSQRPLVDVNDVPCVTLSQHAEFIAHAAQHTVAFWDTSIHTELGRIQHPQSISHIAFSHDDRFLAIGGNGGKILLNDLKDILPTSYSSAPFIDITFHALGSWKQGRLTDTETSLTRTITTSGQQNHHALANRALVRSQLRRWDLAIHDAENSIKIQPSSIGYISKSVALIGSGQKEDGCRVLDLAFRYCDPNEVDHLLLIKAVVLFLAGKQSEAVLRVGDLVATVRSSLKCYVVEAYMHLLVGNSHMESSDYESAIRSFEQARAQMRYRTRVRFLAISLISGWKFDNLGITIRQRLCEALYAAGRTAHAGESLLEMVDAFNREIYTSGSMTKWISDFTRQCLSTPEIDEDGASKGALTLIPLLREWVKATLASCSWKDALVTAVDFVVPKLMICRVICEHLESVNSITDASDCFRQMVGEMVGQASAHDEHVEWVFGKLEILGDTAMGAGRHGGAIANYSAALALDPAVPQHLFIKRSKAYIAGGLWKVALDDANKAIELDPSSPWGYERKHAALHKAGEYENATNAFEMMLSKMSQSSDPEIRELHRQYINPGETKVAIRGAVQNAIRDSPRVLINTVSGRLLDKSEQAFVFESLPVFHKIVSSMMTHIDHGQIKHDVTRYYRYAMFSHKWEDNEPLFEKAIRMVVYDLEKSSTNDKLRGFCEIVRGAGLHWAWSDTCCINKGDHFVLQEALVSMFKWYQGSALTIVYLCDVPLRRLVDSIWNKRAWTLQEYHASKVVRFYNKDWILYLDIDVPNHKESPEIVAEMEAAAGISAGALTVLRPGLDNIREKLCLASTRETTLVEDAAYSLLGIFSMSLPIVYGEGNQALGKLLAQLLSSSGDTGILAWTGKSGSFNSCLPGSITVFKEPPTSHIPFAITGAETESPTARPRSSSLNLGSITKFCDRLNELPVPLFIGKRMKLPCIVFKLGPLSISRRRSELVFRAQTDTLAIVEMKTTGQEDLSRFNPLYLVHPWIDFLLDRQPVGGDTETMPEESADDQSSTIGELPLFTGPSSFNTAMTVPQSRTKRLTSRFGLSFGRAAARRRDAESLRPPSTLAQTEKQMLALRVVARLRQPFGALLLTPSYGNVAAYRRVASESLITVRVEEITPAILGKLVDSVRVLDVL